MTSTTFDLSKMFKAASKTLIANQTGLNQADDYNHNHGDNMVEIFQVINKALAAKKTAPVSEQLEYASQLVAKKSTSGSAAAYSQGLERAAQQFQGRSINAENAVELISALMGSGSGQGAGSSASGLLGSLLGGGAKPTQTSNPTADLLGSLLGGSTQPAQSSNPTGDLLGSLLGGGAPQQSSGSGDMLGSLLGSLMGGTSQPAQSQSSGIDTGDLLNIGMQLFQAYQGTGGKPSSSQGGNSVASTLLDLLLSGSSMGSTSHREQSGKLVADALLKIAAKFLASKRN